MDDWIYRFWYLIHCFNLCQRPSVLHLVHQLPISAPLLDFSTVVRLDSRVYQIMLPYQKMLPYVTSVFDL